MGEVLYYTKSVCPICLRELVAKIIARDGQVFMDKTCEEHGSFSVPLWEDTAESYLRWMEYGGMGLESLPTTSAQAEGIPLAAGDAASPPCTGALMVTNRCNNHCPICFTRTTDEDYAPTLEQLCRLLDYYRETAGSDAPLEFCGGEPTTRDDLEALALAARDKGFGYIQLNTNGIRLAQQPCYAERLREAGITTAYLGFDGVTQQPYISKYGRDLYDIKKRAVENCAAAGLSVVLVACVVPESNDMQLGDIIRYAVSMVPAVKGVYLQPLSYFGAYPESRMPRITIPALLRKISSQTDGMLSLDSFLPGSCEHPLCSFGAACQLGPDSRLHCLTKLQPRARQDDAHLRLRKSVKATWMPSPRKTLTVGGMAFMDAWNLDALRLSKCTIQVIGRDSRLIPLCGKYLTDAKGQKLFPHIN